MEWMDIYDENRNLTGKTRVRGTPLLPGEYVMVVCVWVYDGRGNLLLTRRAPEKSFPGTWENSGGAAQAGEDSLTAICRELWEETGIRAEASEFEFLATTCENGHIYDHYCLLKEIPLEQIRLLPGETDAVRWADFETVHRLIREEKICRPIAKQFLELETDLRQRQTAQ